MTTNNEVNVPLSGSTGSGKFVGSTSPTFVTPTLGSATATSLAFSPTTGSIIGTTAADNASAGNVGEYITSVVTSGSPGALTSSGSPQSLTSITLSAGDWDVWGSLFFIPTGSTIISYSIGGINTTNNVLPDASLYYTADTYQSAFGNLQSNPCPMQRLSLSGSTVVYIVCQAGWTGTGSMTVCGFISGRRIR